MCIHLSTSPSYMPQSNGLAERMVGLCKSSVRKLIGTSSSIDHSLWPYACLWTGELMRHAAIGLSWPYPAFAELVAIKKTQ
eukprot:601985-Amphidinium_carterae.1